MNQPHWPAPRSTHLWRVIDEEALREFVNSERHYSTRGGDSIDLHSPLAFLKSLIGRHPFNETIHLVLPGEKPDKSDIIENREYAIIRQLRIAQLLSPSFVDRIRENLGLHLLPLDVVDIHTQDSVALLPSGKLVLSLTAQTYRRLGLVGHESQLGKKRSDKHVIRIDLCDLESKSGKKHKKFHESLMRSNISFDFLALWDGDKELTKLEELFSASNETNSGPVKIERRRATSTASPLTYVTIFNGLDSLIFPSESVFDISNDTLYQLINWYSALTCQIDFSSDAITNINSPLYESETQGGSALEKVAVSSSTGFYTAKSITEQIGSLLDTLRPSQPFAFIVSGFDSAPVAWDLHGRAEHLNSLSGENIYGIIRLARQVTKDGKQDSRYLVWATADEHSFGIEAVNWRHEGTVQSE